jgi:hypothetical protein
MTSLVLGVIALVLFFLPILGIPLSAFGLLFGIVGFFLSLASSTTNLRWSLAGIATSALALAINLAIVYAPGGYTPMQGGNPAEQPPGVPYVAPPTPAGWSE